MTSHPPRNPRHRAEPVRTSTASLSRRGVLALAGAGVGALALPGQALAAPSARPSAAAPYALPGGSAGASAVGRPAFPGHKPGFTYLGISTPESIESREAVLGKVGLQRSYYQWTGGTGEDRTIKADHAAGRLPWISFKPPGGASTWAAVGAGQYDGDIKVRARRYAGYAKPVVVTFHHEPTNDSDDGASWAKAWVRIHDVMKAETGLKNVTFAPIIGEWAFNQRNKATDPARFLTPAVVQRMPFLGIDCYQNSSGEGYDVRLGRILTWLKAAGKANPMIGLGETGCTDTFGNVGAVQWWDRNWAWVAANSAKIPMISYFDSPLNSKATVSWPLQESAAKLAAYKRSLGSRTATRLG